MEAIKEVLTNILSPLGSIFNFLNPFGDSFIFKDFFSSFDIFSTNTDNSLNEANDGIGSILDYLNPFSDNFFVYKLVDLLIDGLTELFKFLFVPSEDSINNLVNSVKSKFGFIDTINNTIISIKDMFSNTDSLTKIEITLPENDWYNGKVTVMDLAWYAKYKSYGDLIISAFIYVFFIWRIYVHLADIISGSGGSINDVPQQITDIRGYVNSGSGRRSSLTKRQ